MSDVPKVTCTVCGSQHKMSGSPTQGVDCACHYENGRIYGHYESSFDMSLIALSERARLSLLHQGEKFLDPVCDDCIRRWLASDDAVEIGEYNDFDHGATIIHARGQA